ncbi:MAG TPA: hypothetical protein DCE07_08420 [Peptococcaceae bacterium]|nr:hypothetical protein [Peptococcaceae bacterium]
MILVAKINRLDLLAQLYSLFEAGNLTETEVGYVVEKLQGSAFPGMKCLGKRQKPRGDEAHVVFFVHMCLLEKAFDDCAPGGLY